MQFDRLRPIAEALCVEGAQFALGDTHYRVRHTIVGNAVRVEAVFKPGASEVPSSLDGDSYPLGEWVHIWNRQTLVAGLAERIAALGDAAEKEAL